MLNSEGDSDDCSKSKGFCSKIDLQPFAHANYIHGAFVGERSDRPASFEQFKMQYIPHTAVLSTAGRFLGNKVGAGEAVSIALARVEVGVKCQKGHVLEPKEGTNGGWGCDVCNKGAPTSERWRCPSGCDFDMCGNCYKTALAALPAS